MYVFLDFAMHVVIDEFVDLWWLIIEFFFFWTLIFTHKYFLHALYI
jgi:hypothetical protein